MTDKTDEITEAVRIQSEVLYWRGRVNDTLESIRQGELPWQLRIETKVDDLTKAEARRAKWLDKVAAPLIGIVLAGLVAAVVYLIRATG